MEFAPCQKFFWALRALFLENFPKVVAAVGLRPTALPCLRDRREEGALAIGSCSLLLSALAVGFCSLLLSAFARSCCRLLLSALAVGSCSLLLSALAVGSCSLLLSAFARSCSLLLSAFARSCSLLLALVQNFFGGPVQKLFWACLSFCVLWFHFSKIELAEKVLRLEFAPCRGSCPKLFWSVSQKLSWACLSICVLRFHFSKIELAVEGLRLVVWSLLKFFWALRAPLS